VETRVFTVGGTVQASSGMYIRRKADTDLLSHCLKGEYAYVLASRQVGKSSLMVSVARELRQQGAHPVIVDLTSVGQSDVDAARWYEGILSELQRRLALSGDVLAWWDQHAKQSYSERFILFFRAFVLPQIRGRVVVFFDEIDTTLSLKFTDDFFAAIRYLYNERANDPDLNRLSFVLVGVATPTDLIKDPGRTPFNIGCRVDLEDFEAADLLPLVAALDLGAEAERAVLNWVLGWTGGHPYLTQRLLQAIASEERSVWSKTDVNDLVARTFLGDQSSRDSNLEHVTSRLSKRTPYSYRMLTTYATILRGVPVFDNEQSLVKAYLKLAGVVKRKGPILVVRNAIYETVFNAEWVKEQRAIRQERLARQAIGAAVLLAVVAVGLGVYALVKAREAEKNQQRLAVEKALRQEAQNQRQLVDQQKSVAVNALAQLQVKSSDLEKSLVAQAALRLIAEDKTRQAEASLTTAKASAEKANLATAAEQKAKEQAQSAEVVASLRAREAVASAEAAVASAEQAAQNLTAAKAAQASERAILLGLKLVQDADLLRLQQPSHVGEAMLLDIEAYRRIPSTDTLQGLRNGLDKLPQRIARWQSKGEVTSLALSNDGASLIAAAADGSVHSLATPNMLEFGAYPRLGQPAAGTAISASRGIVAVGPQGEVVGGLGGAAGQRLLAIKSDATAYAAVVIAEPKNVNYWSLGRPDRRVLKHNCKVRLGAFSGQYLYTLCDDNTVRRWSLISFGATTIQLPSDAAANNAKFFAAYSAGIAGRRILLGAGASLRVYGVRSRSRSLLQRFQPAKSDASFLRSLVHDGPIIAMATIPPSRSVTTATKTTLQRWDIETGLPTFRVELERPVTAFALSDNELFLAVAQAGGAVTVLSAEGGPAVARSSTGVIGDMAFSAAGDQLTFTAATALRNDQIWNWRMGLPRALPAATGRYDVALSSDGTRSMAWFRGSPPVSPSAQRGVDGKAPQNASDYLVFTDLNKGTSARTVLSGSPRSAAAPALSPNGLFGAIMTNQGLHVFRATTGEEISGFSFTKASSRLAVSPSGKLVAAALPGTVEVVSDDGGTVAALSAPGAAAPAFSNDGRFLAAGGAIWDTQTWKARLNIPRLGILDTVFSANGKYVATRTNAAAQIWDVNTGGQVAVIQATPSLSSIALSPDAKYLATGSASGARVWIWQPGDLIDEACNRIEHSSLSPNEWKRYLGDERYSQTCSTKD
jgi:WD40 repeat protein